LPITLPETIVRRRCTALIPYARNARTHSDQQVAQIAASIREFGYTNPVLIDQEDGIIAGHDQLLGRGKFYREHRADDRHASRYDMPLAGRGRRRLREAHGRTDARAVLPPYQG
jgi:hypothetical protein